MSCVPKRHSVASPRAVCHNGGMTLQRWRHWAKTLKREMLALTIALKDPRTPWHARLVAAVVVGYAFSPIDLIPDFIPVLGYLDDLLLLPLGIALVIKLLPPDVLRDARQAADAHPPTAPRARWIAAAVIIALWLALGYAVSCRLR